MMRKRVLVCRLLVILCVLASLEAANWSCPPPDLDREQIFDVPSGSDWSLGCSGYRNLSWTLRRTYDSVKISESEMIQLFGNVEIERRMDQIGSYPHSYLHRTRLRIMNASFRQTGLYRCSYEWIGLPETSYAYSYVFVNDAENLLITEFIPTSKVLYENATVPCLPTSSQTEVTLWKGEKRVPSCNDLVFDPVKGFILLKPTRYFDGDFSCRANYRNYSQTVSFRLVSDRKKWKPPRLNVEPTVDVAVGSSVRINCSGVFPPVWSIPKPHSSNAGNVTVRRYVEKDQEGYVAELQIDNIGVFQTGLYGCCYESPNCLSKDDRVDLYIFVNDPDNPLVTKVGDDQLGTRYGCVKDVVLCLPTYSKLNVTLWKGSHRIPVNGNVSFDPTLGFVLHTPQQYSYIYNCRTQYGKETKQLKVSSQTLDKGLEMDLHVYVSNSRPFQEEQVEIKCQACTYHFRNILWTWTEFDGTRQLPINQDNDLGIDVLDESTVTSHGRTLRFRSVKSLNDGLYKCLGVRKEGWSNQTKTIELRITRARKPLFVHTNMNGSAISVLPGSSHRFYCLVEGAPPPAVVWYKDDQPISEDPPGVTLAERSQIMTIAPVIEEDEGIFRCRAENIKGFITAETTLLVGAGKYQTHAISSSESDGSIPVITSFVILLVIFLSLIVILIRQFHRKRMERLEEEDREEICISELDSEGDTS